MGNNNNTKLDSLLFATSFAAALDRAQHEYRQKSTTTTTTTTTTDRNQSSSSPKQQQKIETLQRQNDDLSWKNRGLKDYLEQTRDELISTKEELKLLRQQVKILKHQHRASLDELNK